MSIKLPIQDSKFAAVLNVYAPTLQAQTGETEAFYRDLHDLQQVASKDKLLISGDHNARVGRNTELWKGVQGRCGIGNCNKNGRSLLEFGSEHQLVIHQHPVPTKV